MDSNFEDGDDFYAFLNIERDAKQEEISNAYRKLSRVFHPDKHHDPVKKKKAERQFNKVKEIYEVLSDDQKRAIYDTLGTKGLETYGKEVVLRGKGAKEIRDEYDRLVKERDERRLQQSVNPKGSINVGVDATDIFDGYSSEYGGQVVPYIEINAMSITQSVEAPLTEKDTAILSGSLSTRHGNGQGVISGCIRHLMTSQNYCELELAAGNGAQLSLKGYKQISRRSYGTMSGMLQFTPHGIIRPGLSTLYAIQLDKNVTGRVTWNAGTQSSLSTTLIYDNQKHHVGLTMQLGIPVSYIQLNYLHRFTESDMKAKCACKVGTFGAIVEYGFEKKITQYSTIGAYVVVGVPTGVNVKLKLVRGNQHFLIPIHLSEEVVPNAIFYGTLIPIATYCLVKTFWVDPYLTQKKEEEIRNKQEESREEVERRKRDAEEAVELMKNNVERSIEEEDRKGGLIIIKAVYGKLASSANCEIDEAKCIDVRIPLQYLVKDSRLIMPEVNKSGISGFYDPCIGEDKLLYIRYKFHHSLHQVTIGENDRIKIPQEKHSMRAEESTR